MSCEYCEEEHDLFSTAQDMGCMVNGITLAGFCYLPADESRPPVSQHRIVIEVNDGEACTIPIHYCPMCGERL